MRRRRRCCRCYRLLLRQWATTTIAAAAAAATITLYLSRHICPSIKGVRRILVRGVNAPVPPEAKKILKI